MQLLQANSRGKGGRIDFLEVVWKSVARLHDREAIEAVQLRQDGLLAAGSTVLAIVHAGLEVGKTPLEAASGV